MNRSIITAALAIALSLAAGSAAYAWNDTRSHRVEEHGSNISSYHQQTPVAFNHHGGGHEQAADNKTIHAAEMKDPMHEDGVAANQTPAYEQHGGGHEQASDNKTVHESEMRDPKHNDNPLAPLHVENAG